MAGTLLHAWGRTLRLDPNAPAVMEAAGGRVWTRAELAAAAAEWLAGTGESGALRGQRVAVAEPNGGRWWAILLGLWQAGAIPALLDATEPAAAQEATAGAIRAGWLCRDGRLLRLAAQARVRRSDGCLIKLTSGSTGVPAARLFTHAQMLADGRQICTTMGIGADDVNLAVIPFGHSYGLGNLVVPLLVQGTAVVCAGSPLPHALAADISRWRATVFPAVPTLLRVLVRSEVDAAKFETLRLVISAGAPLAAEVAVVFAEKFGRCVHGFYGTTETGGICYDRTGEATREGRSVGAPMDGVRLEFRRGARFTVASAAVGGRGRHSPADRAQLNEHGELVLLGRAGRVVKIAGRRVDLVEIETTLKALPGVREAYAAPTERTDRIAVAVCSEVPAAQLRAAARTRLAPWKVPDQWVVLREFPLTARGKVDTRALRRAFG